MAAAFRQHSGAWCANSSDLGGGLYHAARDDLAEVLAGFERQNSSSHKELILVLHGDHFDTGERVDESAEGIRGDGSLASGPFAFDPG